MADTLVSFVIPTRNRPILLLQAVRSALTQTYPAVEVIIVVDGSDDITLSILGDLTSPNVRVIPLSQPIGGSAARNLGIQHASGRWIALLDDDDEALPERIERQIDRASRTRHRFPVISSRFLAVRNDGEQLLPRRLYRGGSMAKYLFVRKSFRYGDGLMHTSTLLLPRKLLLDCPFKDGLARHQDWDLVLRLASHPGVGFEMVDQPLARVQMQENRASVSSGSDWEFSLAWARERRRGLGRRAYAAFLATECLPRAARAGASRRQQRALLRECIRRAWFSPRVLLLAAGFYFHTRKEIKRGQRVRAR